MKRWLLILALLGGLLGASGCIREHEPVRVASNDFTEQRLLAEMMVLLAENAGIRAEHLLAYGDNRKSLEGLRRGVIDAYPEYSGTLLALTGAPPWTQAGEGNHGEARRLVEPLGLTYLDAFGLDNEFALAVRRDLAIGFGLETISDLARIPRELRVAADEGYLARSVDGLYALARRYGLAVGQVRVFPVGERRGLYRALADRSVDVAEVFRTDARLQGYGVVALRDDLDFFSAYQPAPLVRDDVLARHPELREAWGALAGRIDTETMRTLNGQVERGGQDFRSVARGFLESIDLLAPTGAPRSGHRTVTLAIGTLADRGYQPILAADAIRQVQPAMRLAVETVVNPASAVREGRARFGLVGAEEFFELDPSGQARPTGGIEAVGVVGTRMAHVLAHRDGPPQTQWRRLGTGPEGGTSWHVAGMVLRALGMTDPVRRVPMTSMDAVANALIGGDIDAVVVMVEPQQAGLLSLLQNPELQLVNVGAFRGGSPALRYPFLRPARIPAGTYPGQEEMLETVSAQTVLATRLPPSTDPVGESGPGFVPGVFTRLPQRLPADTARRLNAALDNPETVDPLLPASPGLAPPTPELRPRIFAEPLSALLNGLAIAFLVAMAMLYFRELPDRPALRSGDTPPED